MTQNYTHHCEECKTSWPATKTLAYCPACGTESFLGHVKSDAEKEIEEVAKGMSGLQKDVHEAEAHLAVGITGIENILDILTTQLNHLKEGARRYSTMGKMCDINLSKMEDFFENMIFIAQETWDGDKDELYSSVIAFPSFVNIPDLDIIEEMPATTKGYKCYKVRSYPEWLKQYSERQQNDAKNNG